MFLIVKTVTFITCLCAHLYYMAISLGWTEYFGKVAKIGVGMDI